MKNKFKRIVTSAFLMLILLSSITANSEDDWWEYVFYEELEVGDKIEWEIDTLSYDDPRIESMSINESEGDIFTLEVIHNPNDVTVNTEEYNPDPKSIPSYYFEELPYNAYLNGEKIVEGDLYFIPESRNYTSLIAPYYFRNNTHEFNFFYQRLSEWADNPSFWVNSGGANSIYLNYTYRYDYVSHIQTYCSMTDNSIYNFTIIEDFEYEYQFYEIEINKTLRDLLVFTISYDANTGILFEYGATLISTHIMFYDDYIDFTSINSVTKFKLTYIGVTSRIDFYWFIPTLVTTLIFMALLRRKSIKLI